MDFKIIKDIILAEAEKNIKKVLDGEETEVTLYYIRPNDVIKIVEKLGGEDLGELETNGWQWDYWMNLKYKGEEYMLGGDGYYSDSCTFGLKEK